MSKKLKKIGYSLVEILVGITLLAIGLIAAAGVFPVALSRVTTTNQMVFIVQSAQSQMEYLKSLSYDQLYELYLITCPTAGFEQDPLTDINGEEYPGYKSNIMVDDPGLAEDVIRIRITITCNNFRSVRNQSYVYTIETYRSGDTE